MKKLALLVLLFTSACGGTTVPAGPVYTEAVRITRVFCAAVALLPDPAPVTARTSGGEATP